MPARSIVPLAWSVTDAPAAATAQSPDPPVDLLVGAAGGFVQGDADLGEHLQLSHGGPVGAAVEVAHVEHALAVGSADDHPRCDRRAHRGEVLGRVGLAEGAADRAAVADDRVGDHALGVGEDGEPLFQER